MAEVRVSSSPLATLAWAAQYHHDAVESLKRYFSQDSPHSLSRFDTFPGPRAVVSLSEYLEETNLRSSFAILASIEAAFQLDYRFRCRKRLKDDLSRAFRAVHGRKQNRVDLEEVIFDAWSRYASGADQLIGELRSAFRFRHWLAHGRYWVPKLGGNYDFNYVYRLADAVFCSLPLYGMDEA